MPPPLPPSLPPPLQRTPPQTSTLAVVSLVLSIIGLPLGLLAIPAVICGHLSLSQIKRSRGALGGRTAGIVSLCLGYLGILIFAGSTTLFLVSGKMAKKWGLGGASAETFEVSAVALPTFPEVPPLQPLGKTTVGVAQVDFSKVNKGAKVPPGGRMKLRVYVPSGEHPPHSLACVLVAPAGTNMLVGNDLDDELPDDESLSSDETLPYAKAGMVGIQYSLDGAHDEDAEEVVKEWSKSYKAFRAAGAGTVNGRNALEFALRRLPMVDPERIFSAGHSSAGTVSLLLAANEPRLRGCIAYAPGVDVEEHVKDIRHAKGVELLFPDLGPFLKRASPMNQTPRIKPPVFLFQAKDDSKAPYASMVRFVEKLRETNLGVAFETVETGDHYQPMLDHGIPAGIRWIEKMIDSESRPTTPKLE